MDGGAYDDNRGWARFCWADNGVWNHGVRHTVYGFGGGSHAILVYFQKATSDVFTHIITKLSPMIGNLAFSFGSIT